MAHLLAVLRAARIARRPQRQQLNSALSFWLVLTRCSNYRTINGYHQIKIGGAEVGRRVMCYMPWLNDYYRCA